MRRAESADAGENILEKAEEGWRGVQTAFVVEVDAERMAQASENWQSSYLLVLGTSPSSSPSVESGRPTREQKQWGLRIVMPSILSRRPHVAVHARHEAGSRRR
jgi:hypothetical protein